ncbi:MAG: PadR family transcriptional regulator [Crocinitomicaceae bacterium]|nr:PadR family transcriptional regulator [Crocinitomicaceae bacterium]|tara:strand:+ start:9092 stop:9442 length:351 start_codon:yes stop_codon:yes gene_type:complete
MYSKELLKGTLKTVIVSLLKNGERMYGYEITQKVKEVSGDKVLLTEGALYPMLHKLEAEGVLQTQTEMIGKRVRKYYKLTKSGASTADEMVKEFLDFMETMKIIVEGNNAPQHGFA